MQQTLGIQRQADTGDPHYQTDRTSLPPPANSMFTLVQFCSTRIPRGIFAKRRAPEVLEQSGALVPALPSCCQKERGAQTGTFVLSSARYSLTPSSTCQFPLRMCCDRQHRRVMSTGRRGVRVLCASPGGCSNQRAACLGAAVPAQHQFWERAPFAALEMP